MRHIRAAVSEIHKRLLDLDLFHILSPASTSHHPVYFYSHWQPSTYLSTIFYISPVLFIKNFHCTLSSAQAQRCWILHPLSSNSSLLCFTHPLCSLHDFPHPCHSSWFGSITTQEVCDFVCVEERKRGRNDNLGLLQWSIFHLPEEQVGGSAAKFSFLSSRHAETAVFVHWSAVKAPKRAQPYCRHLSTINRAYREVYRCCDPKSDLAEEMKEAAGQKWLC